MATATSIIVRFRISERNPAECWIWEGATKGGYGQVCVSKALYGKRNHLLHRLMYQLLVGPTTPGLQLDHLCNNKLCFNPTHLQETTALVNTLRSNNAAARNARKTQCKRGHPLSGDNLIRSVGKNGREYRRCRTCWAADRVRYQSTHRESLAARTAARRAKLRAAA